MLFQRTKVWLPVSTPGGSQLPTTPALGILTSFSGSVGTCTRVDSCIPSQRHTHINKNKSKKKKTELSYKSKSELGKGGPLHLQPSLPSLFDRSCTFNTHILCLLVRVERECSPPPQRLMWSSTWSPDGSNALEGCGTFRPKAWLTEAGC